MKEFTPELQSHVRQYMWQCALHRAIALSASAEPTDVKRGPEAVQALLACVAMAEVRVPDDRPTWARVLRCVRGSLLPPRPPTSCIVASSAQLSSLSTNAAAVCTPSLQPNAVGHRTFAALPRAHFKCWAGPREKPESAGWRRTPF